MSDCNPLASQLVRFFGRVIREKKEKEIRWPFVAISERNIFHAVRNHNYFKLSNRNPLAPSGLLRNFGATFFSDFRKIIIVCRLRERRKIYIIVLKRDDGIGIGELPYEK